MKVNKRIYFNIGLMKTGTTWLYSILKNQNNIYFTPEKELHFMQMMSDSNFRNFDSKYDQFLKFSRKLKNNENMNDIQKIRKLKWYLNYLRSGASFEWFDKLYPTNFDGYCCDFSNLSWKANKQLWTDVFDRYDLVKTSIIFRDPLARLWSHAKFHFKILHGKDFDLDENEGVKFIKKYDFIENSSYDLVLTQVENTIGLDRLLILFQEDFPRNPYENIQKIENFLEMKFDYERISGLNDRVNESAKINMPKWLKNNFGNIHKRSLQAFEKRSIDYPEDWSK
jgi:hypothetical protein|tara:strand:- start:2387 stop:3232 length:846 start_codon:yes stop_codon:yes gene_type:complete